MCARPQSKIAWLIRATLLTAVAEDVALTKWLQSDTTRPTYLLFRKAGMSPQVIISKLRGIYGPRGVHFSVLSEKPGRLVICAWCCNETTPLVSPPSLDGQPV
jgi:hypothetical protein